MKKPPAAAAVLLASLLCCTFARPAKADDILFTPARQDDTVRIFATGKKEKQADQAIVVVKLIATDSVLREAITRIGHRRTSITHTLGKLGVKKEQISAARFASLPKHKLLTGKVRNYTVESTLEITIDSENQFLAIARLIDEMDGVEYVSRRVEVGDYSEVAAAASMEALKMLKHKKEQYETALGVKLELISFSEIPVESRGGVPMPVVHTEHAAVARTKSYSANDAFALDTGFGKIEYCVGLEGRYRIAAANVVEAAATE